MSQSPAEEDVVSLTANLAERQATASQMPRLSSSNQPLHPASASPTFKRSNGSGDGISDRSPTRLRQVPTASSQERGPRVDEAAIVEMTGRREEDDAEDQAQHLLVDVPATKPSHDKRRNRASSGSTLTSHKRMTVLIDGEMPEEDSEDEEGNEVESTDADREASETREEEDIDRQDGHENNTPHEAAIIEQDADEGEAEEGDTQVEKDDEIEAAEARLSSEQPNDILGESVATLQGTARPPKEVNDKAVGANLEEQLEMDDEEEEEPALKYSRLKGSVPDVLKKDSASAIAVSDKVLALGTHSGSIYILDDFGNLVKGFRSHTASVLDLVIDSTSEFVGSAGMDGLVTISSLSSSEAYSFDFKRVMRTISLEPGFGRRSTRSFVCGGMAEQLVLREKSWFGHRETILHEGEGPIWTTKWKASLIAWATDRGVRVYDTQSKQRVGLVSPPLDNPRADLFRCSLVWQDDSTLLIAWADHIKVAKVRQRKKRQGPVSSAAVTAAQSPQLSIEIVAILQLDCMISGIAPRGKDYLILAYITEDIYSDDSSIVEDREVQRRKDGLRPELRLVSSDGEELSSDVLSLESFARFQCNDYLLVPSADAVMSGASAIATSSAATSQIQQTSESDSEYFFVVSPKDVIIARSRDEKDHIDWLLQHKHYDDALQAVDVMGEKKAGMLGFDADAIGRRYLHYLVHEQRDYAKASVVAPSILKKDVQAWEDLIFTFVENQNLHHIIPTVPIEHPTLSGVVYDMILAHFLRFDLNLLSDTIKSWPPELYSTKAVVLAIEDRLSRETTSAKTLLMECLAEVFIKNRQPGKALPYFLRLRKPGVFDLIREHNLFTVIQDQALLLVEFEEDNKREGDSRKHGPAIDLLVDHTHSIPIQRVVAQLQVKPAYLHLYLDALFDRDPQQVASYSDTQVKLYAEYDHGKLMAYLRAMSSYYSFENAYSICKQFDYVPEMVFLLSRIGDNKTALTLIIERLQDVERAIEFVKEEKDADLWEDLLRYSENKPRFIKGLLENVGSEVDAVKLIKRIKNGLEIEGLKASLIKILNDFNLQISLLEGCEAILSHDGRSYSQALHQGQAQGQYCDRERLSCCTCGRKLFDPTVAPQLTINAVVFLCRHAHHISCLVSNVDSIPKFTSHDHLNTSQDDTAAATDSLASFIRMTTTQALASGNRHACGLYGPRVRNREVQNEVQHRLRYQNCLRVILKKGCPLCLNESTIYLNAAMARNGH